MAEWLELVKRSFAVCDFVCSAFAGSSRQKMVLLYMEATFWLSVVSAVGLAGQAQSGKEEAYFTFPMIFIGMLTDLYIQSSMHAYLQQLIQGGAGKAGLHPGAAMGITTGRGKTRI